MTSDQNGWKPWNRYYWKQGNYSPPPWKIRKIGSIFASVALFFSTGLAGYQNIIERCLMAHTKAIPHIDVLFINSAICKCHVALKWHFVCHFTRGGTSRLPEHHWQIFYSSYKRYCSYLRLSYKFHHQQVPNGTKNGTFSAVSQVEKLGLLD
jgi:hypothetical protein